MTKHLDYIRQLPCCACFSDRSDEHRAAHHLLRTGEHGMGMKSGDDKTIPLCAKCHNSLHHDGNERRWLEEHVIGDAYSLAGVLWDCSGDYERGCAVIYAGRGG